MEGSYGRRDDRMWIGWWVFWQKDFLTLSWEFSLNLPSSWDYGWRLHPFNLHQLGHVKGGGGRRGR